MNKRELKHFEERLIEERQRLMKELGYFEDKIFSNSQRDAAGDLSAYSVHMADQASDAQEREKAYHMASAEGRLLYHIDEALRRIKEGGYGVCEGCGKKIQKNRLEVVPHARLCIECKKLEENGTLERNS
ncbi:MAG: TraR/DksA C4-type zinc finger protein [Candidatus Eisenbacteria bacterium]|nr:TraR/DksA C4-type zinc finger protein [Candidatus Eisenbacteria bacterium]